MQAITDSNFSRLKDKVMDGTATAEGVRLYNEELKRRDTDKERVANARRKAIQIAKDFYYGADVITAIRECNSVLGINRILIGARGR